MQRFTRLLTFTFLIVSITLKAQDVQSQRFTKTSAFYNSITLGNNPKTALLNFFFTKMPKGADLHHHYTGTIYAETYLEWVKRKNWKIDKSTLRIVTDELTQSSDLLTVDKLLKNKTLYRKLLTLWSDKDYSNHFHEQPPPDKNFFSTFGYFGPVSNQYMSEGLHILKQRAINENVQYIETMLSSVGTSSRGFESRNEMVNKLRDASGQKEFDTLLIQIDNYYLNDTAFKNKINRFVDKVDTVHQGIDDEHFRMRYQSYSTRGSDPLEVYIDLLAAFTAASKSELIVGVNIVGAENAYVALQDYSLHMMMFHYLSRKFPKVNRALHAGELTLGMVRPKDLQFHVEEALTVAKAQRIGHGIDIPYEKNTMDVLTLLQQGGVAVEINLTSNEFILGVKNDAHPYLIYAAYGVPMVISTDDSGVSRNNLTNEFVLLASRYKPTYKQIKKYVYNSIKYSFLTERMKSKELKRLDRRFHNFEKWISNSKLAESQTVCGQEVESY